MTLSRQLLVAAALVAAVVACKKTETPQAATDAVAPGPAAAPAPAPAQTPVEALSPGVVAKVNGKPIQTRDFEAEITKITQGGARNIPDDRLAKIRENILGRLIEEELLKQEVVKQGVAVTDAELQAEFDKYRARFKSDEQFQSYLAHGKTTVEEIKKRLGDTLSVNKLLTKLGKLDVADDEVKSTYNTGIKLYTEPEQVHAVHVLVKVAENAPAAEVDAAKKKAEDVAHRVAKGEDFASLAKQYSDDAMSKEKGGDLGFFRKGVMVPKFEEVAFALKAGEVTKEPVRTPFGFHVIKVLEHKVERVKPFEEGKDQILDSLKNRNLFKARRELVDKLKAEAKIEKAG